MKLRDLKIGQLTISARMLFSIISALFILGIGIGATVASPSSSKFTLFICSIVSLVILAYAFSKRQEN